MIIAFESPKITMMSFYQEIVVTLTTLGFILIQGCTFIPPTDGHLTLGNPSQATASLETPNNYLIEKPQYVLSYNRERGTANWVSWQLNQSWLGSIDRQDDFRPDETLPAGWYQVRPGDYASSGYDRGHLVPSADRTLTEADNSATFLMTNMIPQTPENNRQTWRELEEYSRELVKQGKELYIVAGGSGSRRRLANGKITVPSHTWKVIVVLDQPGSGVKGVTENTPVIAVLIPNQNNLKSWQNYQVSVDQLEVVTGYDFLSNVPAKIQTVIESKVKTKSWK